MNTARGVVFVCLFVVNPFPAKAFVVWGDGEAQFVERWTRDSMALVTRVRIPSGAQEKCVNFSESKMLC